MAKVLWVLVLAAIACQVRGFGIADLVSNSDDEDSSKCPDGLYNYSKNCSMFIQCSNGFVHLMPCPEGLHYSTKTERCERPCDARCDRTYSCRCGWQTCESQICFLPNKAGPCNQTSERYYFDKRTARCVKFTYGGCRGNENNFQTKKECERTCGDSLDICRLPKAEGPCNAHMKKYFFNHKTGQCEKFVYGGCQGNPNRFDSREQCEQKCLRNMDVAQRPMLDIDPADQAEAADIGCGKDGLYSLEKNCSAFVQCTNGRPVVMPCPKGLHFNVQTKRCEQPCDAHCDRTLACKCNWKTCGKQSCKLPVDHGSCFKFSPRYYYDKDFKKCRAFLYAGCLGNENNFVTKKDCKKYCEIKKAVHSVHSGAEPECESPSEVGPCKGNIPRYYYDQKTKKCVKFFYGGCGGNGNNYETINECQAQCWKHSVVAQHGDVEPECDSPPETGPCKANVPRYNYDKKTKKCVKFTYGGCGGNGNNYETINECYAQCFEEREKSAARNALPEYCEYEPEPGSCDLDITRFYYDPEEGECKEFKYGGCQGNLNNFPSKELCENKCKSRKESATLEASLPEYCELEPETGPCKANITKFYYDHEEKECKEFQYGGCQGNRNSFYSKELCERRCKDKDTNEEESAALDGLPDYCELEPVTGPCHANITKFYYDHEEGECKEFQYGGCGGNRNSFYSKERCERKCKSKKESDGDKYEPGSLDLRCPDFNGDFPLPRACTFFVRCKNNVPEIVECPLGQLFDFFTKQCVEEEKAHCLY